MSPIIQQPIGDDKAANTKTASNGTAHQGNGHANGEATRFLEALFLPGDTMLFRPIESWTENGQKKSQVDYKGAQYVLVGGRDQAGQWHPFPQRLATAIQRQNQRTEQTKCNIFFGVCPESAPKESTIRLGKSALHVSYGPTLTIARWTRPSAAARQQGCRSRQSLWPAATARTSIGFSRNPT